MQQTAPERRGRPCAMGGSDSSHPLFHAPAPQNGRARAVRRGVPLFSALPVLHTMAIPISLPMISSPRRRRLSRPTTGSQLPGCGCLAGSSGERRRPRFTGCLVMAAGASRLDRPWAPPKTSRGALGRAGLPAPRGQVERPEARFLPRQGAMLIVSAPLGGGLADPRRPSPRLGL